MTQFIPSMVSFYGITILAYLHDVFFFAFPTAIHSPGKQGLCLSCSESYTWVHNPVHDA